ncbi:ATPase SWSAP1-like [Amphiura filiformis]|uniref:ATPase SWSAP1-like n=1 Tax=Amphiura filiformis TaxID=82378 RepID=UPI003B21043B
MAAPMKRMFPTWATHFSDVSDQIKETIDPRRDLLQLQCPINSSKVLLLGISESGKTALLFQYALSCAMDGMRVVFITHTKIDTMPLMVDGASKPDHILMKQVHIMYFEDRDSLLKYLAGIHTSLSSPDALIVDNLDYYVTHPKSSDHTATIGNLCAFLVDAATFLTNQRSKSAADDSEGKVQQSCQILVSVSAPNLGEFPMESYYTYSYQQYSEFKV